MVLEIIFLSYENEANIDMRIDEAKGLLRYLTLEEAVELELNG